MKTVYIGHPLRGPAPRTPGRMLENMFAANIICARIAEEEPDILILSPIHAFMFYSAEGDQSAVLEKCRALLSLADEARFYGDWKSSEGCLMEIEHARKIGIPVLFPEAADGVA